MPNVFQLSHAAERRAAKRKKEEAAASQADEPDGLLQFTQRAGQPSQMIVRGTYADRLQVGVYALVKGLNDLVDKMAEGGAIGNFTMGNIDTRLAGPPCQQEKVPRRLRESTDFGSLQ